MATVREDVVKVSFDVDDKPIQQVDDSIDKVVQNTQKMAGSSGVGNLTKGFDSLAQSAKKFANTKLDAVKSSVEKFKTSLTGGEKGAKGLANAVKNVAKASLKAVIKGVGNLTQGLGKALAAAGKLAAKLGGMALKGLAVGVGAAATGLAALGTSAIKAYAETEQLVGGIQTLFGDDVYADVVKNANNAYKTAGLSANAYMETVTSFSASLISSLGGDTAKATQYADMAITDMSDNANKMGTDMESIQNAYQGFAKQNYTMLDNLKLGYGGTKEEMGRLLDDAGKLAGKKFDISNYADVVEAIHVVQENMGIAGATAQEASTTIQGSFNSMKGAWQNFVSGLADPDADMDMLIGNLVDSVTTFGKNIIPAIQRMLPRMVEGISQLAQAAATALPGILDSVLPALVDGATSLVEALVTTLQENTDTLSSTALYVITALAQFFLQSLPQILVIGIELIATLASGLAQQMPTLIPLAIQAIFTIMNSLMQNLPTILMAGIQILLALVNGISQMLPTLIPMAVSLILQLAMGLLNNLPTIIQCGIQLIIALIQGLANAIPMIIQAIPQMFVAVIDAILSINWLQVGWDIIKAIGKGLWDGVAGLFNGGKGAGEAAGEGVASGFSSSSTVATAEMSSFASSTTQYGTDAALNLASGFETNGVAITDATNLAMTNTDLAMQTGMNDVKATIESTDLRSSGVSAMQGLNEGMVSMIPTLMATARRIASSIKSATDAALDIHSPSRVMEETGINAGMGQVVGLRKTIPEMQIAARDVSNASIPYDTYSPEAGSTYYNGGNNEYTTISPQFNLTVSGTSDDRATARRIKRYVAEAIAETFESLDRKSYSLREV